VGEAAGSRAAALADAALAGECAAKLRLGLKRRPCFRLMLFKDGERFAKHGFRFIPFFLLQQN
jgi:hypothetical protein